MDTVVWIIIAVVVAIVVIAAVVLIARQSRTKRRRIEAERIREQVREETVKVERREALADETAAGARRQGGGPGQGQREQPGSRSGQQLIRATSRRPARNSASSGSAPTVSTPQHARPATTASNRWPTNPLGQRKRAKLPRRGGKPPDAFP